MTGLLVVVALGLIIAGAVSVVASIKKRARRRAAKYLPRMESTEAERKRRVLVKVYIENDLDGLRQLKKMLEDTQALTAVLRKRTQILRHRDQFGKVEGRPPEVPYDRSESLWALGFLEPLIEENLIGLSTGRNVQVDPEIKDLLTSLLAQLSEAESTTGPPDGDRAPTASSTPVA